MKEQVMVYEIKSGAVENANELLTEKYFYWNDLKFKNLNDDDFVFVINTHDHFVLFTKFKSERIKTNLSQVNLIASFNIHGREFKAKAPSLEKLNEWDNFIKLEIINKLQTPKDWYWKSLGSSENTYLNGPRVSNDAQENRISNIDSLQDLSEDKLFQSVLSNCLFNYSANSVTAPIFLQTVQNDSNTMTLKEIITYSNDYLEALGFQYKFDELANFYLSIKAKPFIILAGISGTGKTQLPRKFAAAIGMSRNQVIQVPVRPDWNDGSDLLGYTGLDNIFKPKDLTIAIKKAGSDPEKPYFFILDEMNLARVEHYFSDFLSVIETREWQDMTIQTDPLFRDEILRNASNGLEFSGLGWPPNLYMIGTVNMDETTHAFSKKVLDRANTIEMNDVDLSWGKIPTDEVKPLNGIGNSVFQSRFLSSKDLTLEMKNSIREEFELLVRINKILEKADLHFAYRIRDEIAFYLILNKEYDLLEGNTALDFQLVQKVLPRIHGSSDRIQTVLVELLNLLEGKDFRTNGFEITQIEGKISREKLIFSRSSKKILYMLKRFDDDRFTSFWI